MGTKNTRKLQRDQILSQIFALTKKFHKLGGWDKLPTSLDDHDKSAIRAIGKLEDELRAEEWREEISSILRLAGLPSYNLDKQEWFKRKRKLKHSKNVPQNEGEKFD